VRGTLDCAGVGGRRQGLRVKINRRDGVAFLVVSHEMVTLRRLCPRVAVMHNGEWIAEGDLETVARDARVIEAYLGRASAAPTEAGA